jgi:hypothetical protein
MLGYWPKIGRQITNRWTQGLRMGDHILHLYSDDEERERAIAETYAWLPRSAKMLVFSPNGRLPCQIGTGKGLVDPMEAIRAGKLQSRRTDHAYIPDGGFHSKRALRNLEDAAENAEDEGFESLVVVGDVSWINSMRGAFPEFIRYETGINFIDFPIDMALICQYDQRTMAKDDLQRACNVHEKILADHHLDRNCWLISRGVR